MTTYLYRTLTWHQPSPHSLKTLRKTLTMCVTSCQYEWTSVLTNRHPGAEVMHNRCLHYESEQKSTQICDRLHPMNLSGASSRSQSHSNEEQHSHAFPWQQMQEEVTGPLQSLPCWFKCKRGSKTHHAGSLFMQWRLLWSLRRVFKAQQHSSLRKHSWQSTQTRSEKAE